MGGIIIMATDTLMVATAITVTMERGRLMLSQDTITMVMDMVDMDTMVTMARERLSQDMAIMVMDTTVNKQQTSIYFFSKLIGTCWNLVNRNTHLEKKIKKSPPQKKKKKKKKKKK